MLQNQPAIENSSGLTPETEQPASVLNQHAVLLPLFTHALE